MLFHDCGNPGIRNFIYSDSFQDTQLQMSTNIVGKVPVMD